MSVSRIGRLGSRLRSSGNPAQTAQQATSNIGAGTILGTGGILGGTYSAGQWTDARESEAEAQSLAEETAMTEMELARSLAEDENLTPEQRLSGVETVTAQPPEDDEGLIPDDTVTIITLLIVLILVAYFIIETYDG